MCRILQNALFTEIYGTSEHPRALSFEATPFNHAQSVSVRYLELIFHVVGFETVHQS